MINETQPTRRKTLRPQSFYTNPQMESFGNPATSEETDAKGVLQIPVQAPQMPTDENSISQALSQNKLVMVLETIKNGSCYEAPCPGHFSRLEEISASIDWHSKPKGFSEEELKTAYLFKEELLELLLDPSKYRQNIFTLMVDTYMWYMTEQELFNFLLAWYFIPEPDNLTLSERTTFNENVKGKMRKKILIFLAEWYSKYRDLVLMADWLQNMFAELIGIIAELTEDKTWIKQQIGLVLGVNSLEGFKQDMRARIEELNTRETKIKENMSRLQIENDISKLERYDIFFYMLKHESRKLAEQICLFDLDNFKLLLPNELLATNWSREKKKEKAPNIIYISECFNRLSRLLTLHVIFSKDKKEFIKRTDEVIQLSDNLHYLNNFNSAYAVHLAISNYWIKNYMEAAGLSISSRAKDAFEKQKQTFSVANGQQRLQLEQLKASFPTVPFLGLYVQQILMLCERKSTYDTEGRINLEKFWDLEKILQKIINTKEYPYSFSSKSKIQELLQYLPPSKKTDEQIKKRYTILIKKYQK